MKSLSHFFPFTSTCSFFSCLLAIFRPSPAPPPLALSETQVSDPVLALSLPLYLWSSLSLGGIERLLSESEQNDVRDVLFSFRDGLLRLHHCGFPFAASEALGSRSGAVRRLEGKARRENAKNKRIKTKILTHQRKYFRMFIRWLNAHITSPSLRSIVIFRSIEEGREETKWKKKQRGRRSVCASA